jgi:hypothetical protein
MSRTKDSLAYAVIFAIWYFVACTGTTHLVTKGQLSSPIPRMLNSTVRNTAAFPAGTTTQPVLASIFGFDLPRPNATITNPSDLAQSFEVSCTDWNWGATGLHAAFGNSGLVPIMPPRNDVSIGVTNDCTAPIASVGADENGNPTGFPIFDSGTINSLVAYGILVSGNKYRCLDTSNTSPLQDNTFVRPYYDLAHDAIVLGSGTTQLSLKCSVSIPAGDDVAEIKVEWVKS